MPFNKALASRWVGAAVKVSFVIFALEGINLLLNISDAPQPAIGAEFICTAAEMCMARVASVQHQCHNPNVQSTVSLPDPCIVSRKQVGIQSFPDSVQP